MKSKYSILLIILILFSCSKEIIDDQIMELIPDEPVPEIQMITPSEGKAATELTISGLNFGTNTNNIQLFFNNTETEITTLTDTSITTNVPKGIETGNIRIIANDQEIMGPEFTYIITPAQVTTITAGQGRFGDATGSIEDALFQRPIGIIRDPQGIFYIADHRNEKIKKIDIIAESVYTFAGDTAGNLDGIGTNALFRRPRYIAFDSEQNIIVSDQVNNRIRRITPNGIVTHLAGRAGGVGGFENGSAETASFRAPMGIVVDVNDNIYVSDFNNHSIRRINPNGEVSTIAGNGLAGDIDGVGSNAQFKNPVGITIDADGILYVADFGNNKIKKINPNDGRVTTVAGSGILGDANGPANEAQFNLPQGVLVDDGGIIYVTDTANHKIKKIDPNNGLVTTIAGSGELGSEDGEALDASFINPIGIFLDEETQELYITTGPDIRKVTPAF